MSKKIKDVETSKFKRNAKLWGIEFTPEFLEAFRKTNKVLNNISRHIRKMVERGDIVEIAKLGYVTFSETSGITNPNSNSPDYTGDPRELTKAQVKDLLYHLFPEDIEEKKESLKREMLMYVLERYSGYFQRNGNTKVPTISIKGKGLYLNDRVAKIDTNKKTLTIPTLYGTFELKYNHSLKHEFLTHKKYGGNLNIKQRCFVAAIDVPFVQKYQAECYLGFDLNKCEKDWVVLNDGTKISAPDNISEAFDRIRELNRSLDQDKKLPVKQRRYRSKQRRKLRLQWKREHRNLRRMILRIAEEIIQLAISKRAHLCIDSVKTGQRMGTFGQDHLIPLLQTMCENMGIPFHVVPCKNTSRRCNKCGYVHKDNRVDTETFVCQSCGVRLDAQENGAKNVAYQGSRLFEAGVPYGNWAKRNIDKLIAKYSTKSTQV